MCCHQKCFAEKKVFHLVYHKISPERCTRFETLYSPFSAEPQYASVIPLKIFTVNCSSATLFLFFCGLPGPVSHIARIKFNNTIALFSIKLNYSQSTFKETAQVIYNLFSRVISTPLASTNPTAKTGFPEHVPELPLLSNEQE